MLESFNKYSSPTLKGVRLPTISIEPRHYDELGVSPDISNYNFLRRLCWKGVEEKGIDKLPNKDQYFERIKMELETLKELGFDEYMLLNWEILNFCREKGIPTNDGRGSAAGSLVAYLLGITKVDPFEYGLFFERFVSKSRAKKIEFEGKTYLDGSLVPDIDNDIDYSRRGEVIKFIEERHTGKTCKILTLNTLSGKLCMKECVKIVEGKDEQTANDVSESIPKKFGKVLDFEDALKESEKFAFYTKLYPKAFAIAKKIEGLSKNTGVHPSGIAICHDLLIDTMPFSHTKDGELVSGFEMGDVGAIAIKFDILGLRTLTVLDKVFKMANVDPKTIDVKDKETFDFLQNLLAPQGLFQIETDTAFGVCKKVRPKNIMDLSAVLALARPGALAFVDQYAKYSNLGEVSSAHEFFDDVLGATGGIPLYQEQLISMARKVGFTADEGEQLRRIVGKKKVEQMKEWKDKISNKIKENNLAPEIGDVLWKVAEDSANYSFNASHSIAYSMCSFRTSYAKVHYPKEFFLALLQMAQNEPDPFEEIFKISQELALFNIKLLPPDLVKSQSDFSIEGNNIRFGLSSIKGVSDKSIDSLMSFRNKENNTKYDIFIAAKEVGLNIGNLCTLIQAGCLDSFGSERSLLTLQAQVFNQLTEREKPLIIAYGEAYNYDVMSCLKAVGEGKILNEKNKPIITEKRLNTLRQKYAGYKKLYDHNKQHQKFCNWYFERKLLGYAYSYTLRDVFQEPRDNFTSLLKLLSVEDGDEVRLVGVLTEVYESKSKKNDAKYCRLSLSDEGGKACCLFMDNKREKKWSDFCDKNAKPKEDDIVVIVGKKQKDVVFVEKLSIIDTQIFLKTSQLKD